MEAAVGFPVVIRTSVVVSAVRCGAMHTSDINGASVAASLRTAEDVFDFICALVRDASHCLLLARCSTRVDIMG